MAISFKLVENELGRVMPSEVFTPLNSEY